MVTPPKVRRDATVDFDHHSDAFNLNELAVNADLRQRCPVAWNENYGGFWFLSSYDAVSNTARDGDTFRPGLGRVASPHAAVDHEIGGLGPGVGAAAGEQEGQAEQDAHQDLLWWLGR